MWQVVRLITRQDDCCIQCHGLKADSINNRGGLIGGNAGSDITLRTDNDLNNIGGTLRGGNLALAGDLNSETTTFHTQTGDMSVTNRRLCKRSQGHRPSGSDSSTRRNQMIPEDATGKEISQTALNIQAKGNLNLKANQIDSAGDSYLSGQESKNLSTVDTGFAESAVYNWSKKYKTPHQSQRHAGSRNGDGTVRAARH